MLNVAFVCVCAIAWGQVIGTAARSDSGNFLDDKWLSGRWDKFRDEPGTWNPGKPFDQALDPAKDPCLKIKCGRHKVCVADDYQTASCVSQRRMSFKEVGLSQSPVAGKCTRCPVVHPAPVCGTDGHSYSTQCKLEYQTCISGKQISVKCTGQCPCSSKPSQNRVDKKVCTDSELREVVSRLRDWFKVLHENGNQNKKLKTQKPEKNRFDGGLQPVCKDSLGWMFTRLDTNFDLLLDPSELRSLYPDKNDRCAEVFFGLCDARRDGFVSSDEWCTCFQRHQDTPCQSEIATINKQQAGKKLLGQYVPTCDADGFFKSHQCHGSSGQCWCVDRYGNEMAGSRTHGPADCGVTSESSGDFGSGDARFPDDEDSAIVDDDEEMDDEGDEDDDEGDDEGYLS